MLTYFKAYADFDALTVEITDAEKANLLLMAYRYATTGAEPVFIGNDRFYWAMMKAQIDRDQESYDKKVSAGAAGGRPAKADESTEKQTKADESTEKQSEPPFKNKNKNKTEEQEQDQDQEQESGDTETRAREGALDRRFTTFWAAYPNKTGKGAALKAFQRIRPDDALLDTMLSQLELMRASPQWQSDGGRYIPNPATWLNQRRWEDEVRGSPPVQNETARLMALSRQYAEMGV